MKTELYFLTQDRQITFHSLSHYLQVTLLADWYDPDYYNYSQVSNPTGPIGPAEKRVVRGGNFSWNSCPAVSAFHDWWEPYQSYYDTGFRCVFDNVP